MSPLSLLLILSLLSLLISPTISLSFEQQLAATETSLRISNYNLFGNAISTSDLRYRLLSSSSTSNASFTLFAPLDSTLYSLDMISPATAYTQTLYYHVVNGRHTIDDLQRVCYLDTLLTHYSVLINQNAANDTVVDGVAIALPDLFVGSRIVVHGLDGILVPGELGLDDPVRDPEFHRQISPQPSIQSDLDAPAFSPVSFNSPTMSPMSFETPADFHSAASSPAPEMMSPKSEPESVASPISSPISAPSQPESSSKSSKRKNRGKVARSKGRRPPRARNVPDRHERFSKFIDRHGSDF